MNMGNTEPFVIVFTTDGKPKPLQWLVYALRSGLDRFAGFGVKYVICTNEPDAVEEGLKSEFVPLDDVQIVNVCDVIGMSGLGQVSSLKFNGRTVPPIQMFRIALPIVPELLKYRKVVFCDTDIGFESAEFLRIFEEDVCGYDVAASHDCTYSPRVAVENCSALARNAAFSLAKESCRNRIKSNEYCSAGVMLMNLERLRESHGDYAEFLRTMVNACVKNGLPQLDQSLVNLFFDVKFISASYNCWEGANYTEGLPVYLRHFPGARKFSENFYPPKNGMYQPKNKIDILYTVGKPSAGDDIELKWSLRSVAKYGRNVGRIIVTSPFKRDWLSDEVRQVECNDIQNAGYKHHNILHAILHSIGAAGLHGEFLVSSDDHFYVKETDFARYPFHVRDWRIKKSATSSKNLGTMIWKQSCVDTGVLLEKHGLPTVDFQGHMNSHWNADLVKDNVELFDEAMKMRYCVEPHVLMQNLWLSRTSDLPLVYRHDAKLHRFVGIPDKIHCISCYDETFNDKEFVDFMNAEFGEKCKYEK